MYTSYIYSTSHIRDIRVKNVVKMKAENSNSDIDGCLKSNILLLSDTLFIFKIYDVLQTHSRLKKNHQYIGRYMRKKYTRNFLKNI